MDTRGAPGWVSGDHPEDQISRFLRQSSPPCWLSDPGDEAPIETEACPMPANHRLQCDDDPSFFPGGPEPMGHDPEQFVEQIQPWPRTSTFQNGELLPKREILQHQLSAAMKEANEYSEAKQEQVVHEPEL